MSRTTGSRNRTSWQGSPALAPLAVLYRAVTGTRRLLYDAGLCATHQATVPVISVGNLTLGGTGKTPMVAWACRTLLAAGRRPAIVSRGYRRKSPLSQPLLVSDGQTVFAFADQAGDEPSELARLLPGVPVAVCSRRVKACTMLTERGLCDCIVLDDGFQHWQLARNADIVLVDSTLALEQMRLFPAGTLREPLAAVHRATAVVHTRAETGQHVDENERCVARLAPSLPQFRARFVPQRLAAANTVNSFDDGTETLPLDELRGRKVVAFAGLAHPEVFFRSIEALGAEVRPLPYPDHMEYTDFHIAHIWRHAVAHHCDLILTTAKDGAKLRSLELPVNLHVLLQTVEITNEEAFRQLLLARL